MPTAHQAYLRARAFLYLAVLALTACAIKAPLDVAQTPEQKYAAVKLTYDALLTPALEFVSDTSIPASTRRTVQGAVAQSGELYKSLNKAYIDYVAAKAQLAAGTTTADKVTAAAANLATWEQQLEDVVGSIATALQKH